MAKLSKETIALYKEQSKALLLQGLNAKQVALKVGCSPTSVAKWHPELASCNLGHRIIDWEKYKQDIVDLRNQGKGYSEISRIIGIDKTSIAKFCKKNNIEMTAEEKDLSKKYALSEDKLLQRIDTLAFEYLGGYKNYDSTIRIRCKVCNAEFNRNADGSINYNEPINTAAAAERRGEIHTCPIAYDADGNMLTDAKGIPLPMYYCYNESYRYKFQGGDAIYEDINHDGQIDRYDMVYLGNSNPKCNGGFGINLYYGRLSLNAGFNFRVGNQIVNMARMNLESMLNNTNQSYATTWRWRKNGDETVIPRALSSVNGYSSYNSLPSDRYVENGDYLRLQYVQLSYDFDAKKLKKYGINQLKLFASVDNLWCWTKYTGVDPDVSPQGFAVSTDNNRTPRTKSFTCSLTLGF